MDSFYDEPRKLPIARVMPPVKEKVLPAAVPDASLLIQNKGNVPQRAEMSYNAWKLQHMKQSAPALKQTSILQPSICKKQVRFQSPNPQGSPREHIKPQQQSNIDITNLRNTRTNQNDNYVRTNIPENNGLGNNNVGAIGVSNARSNNTGRICNYENIRNITNLPQKMGSNNILQAKPFEKLYMANIPNRTLDLSIIEPPKFVQPKVSPKLPLTSKENQKPLSPIMQQSGPVNLYEQYMPMKRHPAESTTIEVKQPVKSDEPTMSDLLKIIQQQNDQLMCLQKQVSTLLNERTQEKQIAQAPEPITFFKNDAKNGLPKFSFDVMTSFEVSIRPQRRERDVMPVATIKEITNEKETEHFNRTGEVSLSFNEPLVVREDCPSPENSIHVDMQDFSSESEDEETSSLIGWTIYNNVMGQVNNLLKKSDTDQVKIHGEEEKIGSNVMKKVKEATLKHLKNVGINLPNVENDSLGSNSDSSSNYTPTEVSFAVKQLLMKYLPDEQLAKLNVKKQSKSVPQKYPTNLIKRRPDFSMATVQYMEKYNLLNKGHESNHKSKPDCKLLDITALKKQPKLM